MPFVRITLRTDAPLPESLPAALAESATTLMAEVLRKKRSLTSVLVEVVPPAAGAGCWTIGGVAQGEAAVCQAFVTAGTNTVAEKAAFLDAMTGALRALLPTVHDATYVIVTEVPADSWGYGGVSQAARAAGPGAV